MRDTSVRQSVRIASDYCRLQLEEGKPHFLFGEELEKNTSTLEEALFHEDGSPKGSQAISRNWTARFRAVPWDVAIPLLFVRAVEIISNEITDRNNGIEKLEKKSFFFFFRGWKMKRGFGTVTNDSERVEWSREAIDFIEGGARF